MCFSQDLLGFMFQSLVGTLKTGTFRPNEPLTRAVSIPRRYAKNGYKLNRNPTLRLGFQSLVGTLKTWVLLCVLLLVYCFNPS